MKTLVAFLAFGLVLASTSEAAAATRAEVKTVAKIEKATAVPDCADGMDPGTICRYVPLNSVTFNIPNAKADLPALPLKLIMPAGLRSIGAQIHLEVSPTTVCDPAPSDVYDGVGGLTIDCEAQQ
jgi:histidinol dehydrogenase